jgi:hypothetical protein
MIVRVLFKRANHPPRLMYRSAGVRAVIRALGNHSAVLV